MVNNILLRFVCKGKFFHDKNLYVSLHEIDEDEELKDGKEYERYYKVNRNLQWLRPGMIYEIQTEGSKIFTSKISFIKAYEKDELILRWTVETKAAEIENTRFKNHKKYSEIEESLKVLEPIRLAYQNTNQLGKLSIEVSVLSYLRKNKLF